MESKNYTDLKGEIDNLLLERQKTGLNDNHMSDNGISIDLGRLNFSMNRLEKSSIDENYE